MHPGHGQIEMGHHSGEFFFGCRLPGRDDPVGSILHLKEIRFNDGLSLLGFIDMVRRKTLFPIEFV